MYYPIIILLLLNITSCSSVHVTYQRDGVKDSVKIDATGRHTIIFKEDTLVIENKGG
jgi:hypothetical protein